MQINRRNALKIGACGVGTLLLPRGWAANWDQVLKQARGQQIFFNAWGGSENINSYLQWVAERLQADYGVKLNHVKITDTSEVVQRIKSENAAGRHQRGSVDAVWVNGENFAALKNNELLFGPFTQDLPNFDYVDVENKPTTLMDFSESTDGLEAPWGMAHLTFFADSAITSVPPTSMSALLEWTRANPGAFTYPAPPDFHGTTFLKQAALEISSDKSMLYQPSSTAAVEKLSAELMRFLEQLHPNLWRSGKQFPSSHGQLMQMFADRETLICFSFNPNDGANRVASGQFSPKTYGYQHSAGSVANTHFVAIPYNSANTAGAQVLANFLLSPEAQARKADITIWGDPTVLALGKLNSEQRQLFQASSSAPGSVRYPGPAALEPHSSWVAVLEEFWARNYGG